jgi:hypothetical protein
MAVALRPRSAPRRSGPGAVAHALALGARPRGRGTAAGDYVVGDGGESEDALRQLPRLPSLRSGAQADAPEPRRP